MMERKLDMLGAKIEMARAQVESARAKMETPRAKQTGAKARLEQAGANVARLTTLMGYARIEAPFDGVVTERYVDPGAMIQTAASSRQAAPIVTVMNVEKVRIYVDVPDGEAVYVREGNPTTLTVRELPGREFKGTVARFTTALDPGTRTMRVEINVPNPNHTLRAGMYGNVALSLDTRRNVLVLPARCLITEKQKKSVLVVEGGMVKKAEVTTGADDGSHVEILSGLKGKEDVIIRGSGVSPGMAVTGRRMPSGSARSKGY
jgi:RND family efflux transporter MFP subunit